MNALSSQNRRPDLHPDQQPDTRSIAANTAMPAAAHNSAQAGHPPDENFLRRAYHELNAGHFEQTRAALLPWAGLGDVYVDVLLGLAEMGAGNAVEAARLLCRVAALTPQGQHPVEDAITMFATMDRRADVVAMLSEALTLAPEDARLYDALGNVLTQMGQFDEAVEVLETAHRLRPHALYTINRLAIARAERGETEKALEMFRGVLAQDATNGSAYSNIGCLLSAMNRTEEALDIYRTAIQAQPLDAQIRLNHSIALLKAGRFAHGWAEHEWRLKLPGHSSLPRDRLVPPINENTDLTGKRILVTQEEGLGDTLMYLRYIAPLARRGAIMHLWVPDSLEAICQRVEGAAEVQIGGTTPEFDWHCPFISLPRVVSATSDAMGEAVPYLSADPEKIRAFAKLVPQNGRLNVGLVWGGAPRPEQTSAHMVDRKRSIGLPPLAPLGAVEGINLISLQKGPYADHLADAPPGMDILDLSDRLDTMDDTAALLVNLDVLVSVDTSCVHLAGGLNVPVILLDRFDNCWRWLSGREDSVWYPRLRIIRQERAGDWTSVVTRTGEKLREMAAEKAAGEPGPITKKVRRRAKGGA